MWYANLLGVLQDILCQDDALDAHIPRTARAKTPWRNRMPQIKRFERIRSIRGGEVATILRLLLRYILD